MDKTMLMLTNSSSGQEFEVSANMNFHPRSSITDVDVKWLIQDGTRRVVNAKSEMSTRKTKKGVELVHVVSGSTQDWNGHISWRLLGGRGGYTDFDFKIYGQGKVSKHLCYWVQFPKINHTCNQAPHFVVHSSGKDACLSGVYQDHQP
jgi:hypothetical protein